MSKRKKKGFVRTVLTISIVGVVGVIVASILLFYSMGVTSGITGLIAPVLPVARIGSMTLTLARWNDELQTVSKMHEAGSVEDIEQLVINKIVADVALRSLASQRDIVITDAERRDIMLSVLGSDGSDIDGILGKAGISEKQFVQYIVEPIALQKHLSRYELSENRSNAGDAIMRFYERVVSNADTFDAAAKDIFETDVIPYTLNDIVFSTEDLSRADLAILSSYKVNEVSSVIASYDGYRVYKILASFTEPEEAINVRELFVSSDPLQAILEDAIQKTRIVRYARNVIPSL